MFDPTGSPAFRASFCIGQVRGSVGPVPSHSSVPRKVVVLCQNVMSS